MYIDEGLDEDSDACPAIQASIVQKKKKSDVDQLVKVAQDMIKKIQKDDDENRQK